MNKCLDRSAYYYPMPLSWERLAAVHLNFVLPLVFTVHLAKLTLPPSASVAHLSILQFLSEVSFHHSFYASRYEQNTLMKDVLFQLRWLMHLERMKENRQIKMAYMEVMKGNKPRDRPGQWWQGNLEEDICTLRILSCLQQWASMGQKSVGSSRCSKKMMYFCLM